MKSLIESAILALETSSDHCSVALLSGKKQYYREAALRRDHTQVLLQFIDEVLHEADLSLKSLNLIAFGQGPGSFTGLRVAAAVTQGLSLGAEVPIMKISSLRALALEVYHQTKMPNVLVGIDAKQGEMYWGGYSADLVSGMKCTLAEACILPEAFPRDKTKSAAWILAGNAWVHYSACLGDIQGLDAVFEGFPRATAIAQLAALDLRAGSMGLPTEQATPVYLQTFRLGGKQA